MRRPSRPCDQPGDEGHVVAGDAVDQPVGYKLDQARQGIAPAAPVLDQLLRPRHVHAVGQAGIMQGLPGIGTEHVELDRGRTSPASAADSDEIGMAGMRDRLGLECRVALGRLLQDDMVEADDDDPIAAAGRLEQGRHAIDGDVRALRFLDLEHDPHIGPLRPVEGLGEGGDPRAGEARMKSAACVELADLGKAEVGGEAVSVGGAVDRQVVQDDRLAIGGQHDVDLDAWSRRRPWPPRKPARCSRESAGCSRGGRKRARARPRGREN